MERISPDILLESFKFLMPLLAGALVFFLIFLFIRETKTRKKKHYNNLANWAKKGCRVNFFSGKLLDKAYASLENNERLIGCIYVKFYPPRLSLLEDLYCNAIYITDQKIVLTRIFLFNLNEISYKFIPFSVIKDIKFEDDVGRKWIIEISLVSGEVYNVVPRTAVKKLKELREMKDFLKTKYGKE